MRSRLCVWETTRKITLIRIEYWISAMIKLCASASIYTCVCARISSALKCTNYCANIAISLPTKVHPLNLDSRGGSVAVKWKYTNMQTLLKYKRTTHKTSIFCLNWKSDGSASCVIYMRDLILSAIRGSAELVMSQVRRHFNLLLFLDPFCVLHRLNTHNYHVIVYCNCVNFTDNIQKI